MAGKRTEIAAILLLTAIWGIAFLFVKIALRAFTPWQLVVARFVPTIPAFAWLVWRRRARFAAMAPRDWWTLLAAGLLSTASYNIALNTGQTRVGAAVASLVVSLNPPFIIAAAILLRGERVRRGFLFGAGLAFLGVITLTLARHGFAFNRVALSGVLILLGTPVSWSLYTILLTGLVQRIGAVAAAAASTLVGSLLIGLTAPVAFRGGVPNDTAAWACALFIGYCSTVLGFTIWGWLLRRRGAARTGIVVYLTVLWGVGFAWTIGGEAVTWQQLCGALFILSGVAVARYSARWFSPRSS